MTTSAAYAPGRRGAHRGSTIAALPPELFAQFRRWFRDGVGYRQIRHDMNALIDAYNEANAAAVPHLTTSAITRWWQSVEGPAAREAAARVADVEKLKMQLEASLAEGGDAQQAIINVAELIVLKRSGSLEDVPIKDLGYLLTALTNAKARTLEIDLQKSRLENENEKLRMQQAAVERELAKQKAEDERRRVETERLLAAAGSDRGDKTAAVIGKIKEIWGFK